MTLADDLRTALPDLRAQAESLMVESGTVSTTERTWDELTASWVESATVLWSGRCKVARAKVGDVTVGGFSYAAGDPMIAAPWDSPTIPHGSTLVLASGRRFTIRGEVTPTWAVERRYAAQEVTDG